MIIKLSKNISIIDTCFSLGGESGYEFYVVCDNSNNEIHVLIQDEIERFENYFCSTNPVKLKNSSAIQKVVNGKISYPYV